MRRIPAWIYLACAFAVFWILFATMLIGFSDFPFLIISTALTTLLLLSVLVTVLAWAYTRY